MLTSFDCVGRHKMRSLSPLAKGRLYFLLAVTSFLTMPTLADANVPAECLAAAGFWKHAAGSPIIMQWKIAVATHILHERARFARQYQAAMYADTPLPPGGAATIIRFCADHRGRIVHVQVARSSGFANLDALSMRVVALSSPIPALPLDASIPGYDLKQPFRFFPP